MGVAVFAMAVSGCCQSNVAGASKHFLRDAHDDRATGSTTVTVSTPFAIPSVIPPGGVLPYRVVDAAYDTRREHLVLLSQSPPAVHFVAPDHGETAVNLSSPGLQLTISPDGKTVGVLHYSQITLIDVDARSALSVATSSKLSSIVMAESKVLGVSAAGNELWSMRLASLAESIVPLNTPLQRGVFVPSLARVYSATRGTSPIDVGRFELGSSGTLVWRDSRYHGDRPICGDVWPSAAGERIFTGCASVFSTSSLPSLDLVYNGRLPGLSRVRSIAHSAQRGELAVIPRAPRFVRPGDSPVDDTSLLLFEYEGYARIAQVALPEFSVRGRLVRGRGRAVFASRDGQVFHVLVEADEDAGLTNGFAVVSLNRDTRGRLLTAPVAAPTVQGSRRAVTESLASSWRGLGSVARPVDRPKRARPSPAARNQLVIVARDGKKRTVTAD